MKLAFLSFLCYIISVKTETPNWTPIGSPLITGYPCEGTKDIVTWFDPSLPPREKNRYYVYIHKVFPENSRVRLTFDSEVIVTINFRTEAKKHVRFSFEKGEHILLRFFKEIKGLGFIVKGAVPGIIPYFKSISINNEQMCYRPYMDYLDNYIDETLTSGPQANCGVPKVKFRKKPVFNGAARLGEWPWHTAIYRLDETTTKYICGGTLISKSFVLTAAHCASLRGVPFSPEVLNVILGKFKLKNRTTGSQKKEVWSRSEDGTERQSRELFDDLPQLPSVWASLICIDENFAPILVQKIILHERFEYKHLYSDIALLKLKSEAIFTKYVQPACLWYSKAVEKLPNETITGTVVGWGLNSTATLTNRLKQAKMPMVSESTCVLSNSFTYSDILVDDTKFCAGYHNGTSACNGDSGSAFQVFVPDEVQNSNATISGAWYVRGIVSLMASKYEAPVCDPSQYVVFTNIEYYRVWIDAYIDNEDY